MSVYYVGSMAYDSDYLAHHGIKGQKWGVRRSREELGWGSKGHLNAIQRRMAKQYSKSMNKANRLQSRIDKRSSSGKDVSKLVDKAKTYMNNAKLQKSMAATYSSLSKYEQRKINKGYRQIRRLTRGEAYDSGRTINPIGRGRMQADTYLKAELLSRAKHR